MKLKDIALWTLQEDNFKNIQWLINNYYYDVAEIFTYQDYVDSTTSSEKITTQYINLICNHNIHFHKIQIDLNNDILIDNDYILIHFAKLPNLDTRKK